MINIFLDHSGSMQEMGKKDGLIYVAKSIKDYCDFYGIKLSFFDIHSEVIPKIENLKLTNRKPNFLHKDNSIFISDGLIKIQDFKFDITVGVGIDANYKNLENISKITLGPENSLIAIEYLLYANNINLSLDEKEQEDEW